MGIIRIEAGLFSLGELMLTGNGWLAMRRISFRGTTGMLGTRDACSLRRLYATTKSSRKHHKANDNGTDNFSYPTHEVFSLFKEIPTDKI